MNLTGNPFVDTGLMVIVTLAEKRSVDDLTFVDVKSVYGDGSGLARQNQRLKSYTMVFGTNGSLTQPAYKKIGKNQVVYEAAKIELTCLDTIITNRTGPPLGRLVLCIIQITESMFCQNHSELVSPGSWNKSDGSKRMPLP